MTSSKYVNLVHLTSLTELRHVTYWMNQNDCNIGYFANALVKTNYKVLNFVAKYVPWKFIRQL
ncbi:unnamed protein product, partial [Rotaria sp. Silwood2]